MSLIPSDSVRTARIQCVVAALVIGTASRDALAQERLQTWAIDPHTSSARFEVRHLVVSSVSGRFNRLSGTVRIDEDDLRTLAVDVAIDAASIDTQNASRDADLRSPKFFAVETFPTITFVSTRVEHIAPDSQSFTLVGELTMHGTTRETTLRVTGGPWHVGAIGAGANRLRAIATGTLKRHDFGLTYNRLIEGAAVVGEDVSINIDVEAVPSPSGDRG